MSVQWLGVGVGEGEEERAREGKGGEGRGKVGEWRLVVFNYLEKVSDKGKTSPGPQLPTRSFIIFAMV